MTVRELIQLLEVHHDNTRVMLPDGDLFRKDISYVYEQHLDDAHRPVVVIE